MKYFFIFIFIFLFSSSSFAKNWLDYYYILLDKAKGQVSLQCKHYGNSMIDNMVELPLANNGKYNIVLKIIEPIKIMRFEEFQQNKFELVDLTNIEAFKFTLWEVNNNEFQIFFDNIGHKKETMIKINRLNGTMFARGTGRFWDVGECKQGALYKPKQKF